MKTKISEIKEQNENLRDKRAKRKLPSPFFSVSNQVVSLNTESVKEIIIIL